jgi:hypothetical protein
MLYRSTALPVCVYVCMCNVYIYCHCHISHIVELINQPTYLPITYQPYQPAYFAYKNHILTMLDNSNP